MKIKIKFTLALVLMAFTTASWAGCTKSEVMKLIDKGFSKAEINSICDIQAKSTAKPKPKSKWISPARKACTKNGGKLKSGGICAADWYNAKRICSAAGGRLPNINELKSVVTSCGGEIDDDDNNANDSSYQSCYKRQGFLGSVAHWSSSSYVSNTKLAWFVYFKGGYASCYDKAGEIYVRCVRDRQ